MEFYCEPITSLDKMCLDLIIHSIYLIKMLKYMLNHIILVQLNKFIFPSWDECRTPHQISQTGYKPYTNKINQS